MGIEAIEGVERCITVLRAISRHGGLTISALARHTEISRAAVNRFVISLVELGYVYSDPRTHTYHVTSKTLELSKGVSRDAQLRQAVLPVLQKTCRDIGWSLNFSTIRNVQLTLIAHTDSISPVLQKQRDTTLMRPLLGRAGGHVLLAFLSDAVRADILAIAEYENPSIYDDAGLTLEQVQTELAEIRSKGYAVSTLARTAMHTLAVPVHIGESVPFSLSAGAYASVLPLNKVTTRLLKPLQACSKRITQQLKGVDTERWLPRTRQDTRPTPEATS